MIPNKVSRIVQTDCVALLAVALFGLFSNNRWHVHAALTLVQLLSIELLLQSYPLLIMSREPIKKNKRHHVYVKLEIVVFGLLSAVTTYAGFYLFFAQRGISPVYLDTTHPLYAEATTIAYLTLAVCQFINLVFIRADERKKTFDGKIWNNKKLNLAYGVSFLLLLNVVYNPLLHSLLGTASLSVIGWLLSLSCAAMYLGLRLVQRHTRQHTRHAVVQLHHELHGHK